MKTLPLFTLILSLLVFINANSQTAQKHITVEDIYRKNKFAPKTVSGINSMCDGKYYTINNSGRRIEKYDFKKGEKAETLMDIDNFKGIDSFNGYSLDLSGKKILFYTDKEKIYRHSFRAAYYVFDIQTKKLVTLSGDEKEQLAEFSPSSDKVAFVRHNNIYISDLSNSNETQVTFDGVNNEVINGSPDWVYEEEFGFSEGFHWSPDGKRIAYYRFDESHVREFHMTTFGELYPEIYKFKYPKAGERNSAVSIHIYNLETGITQKVEIGEEPDQYIPRIKWTRDPEILSVVRLNRLQNHLEILHADAATGKSEVVYAESNKSYISETSDNTITYLPDNKHFILLSEHSGYFHFYLYDFIEKQISPITSGEFDVSEFAGYDEESKRLYYTSFEESTTEQHLYSINIDGSDKDKLSTEAGFNSAIFNDDFSYYMLYLSSINAPEIVTLYNNKGKKIRILEDNARIKKNMNDYGFAKAEFLSIKTKSGQDLNAYMIKPNDFDPEKKYPLFIYVYGGPESQKVADKWEKRNPWFQLLVQQGYIVACVDNRGTNGRGEAFRKSTYMQLGKFETIDQVEAATFLGELKYIDEQRIGIFGWSYGGYMTSLCMTKGGGLFKMGIAVAPVTNWRYYDTVYTERFMRKPAENPDGYDENSPIYFANQLEGKFLLIHGSGDDNVHIQNSIDFSEALVQANKQFEMQFYPNKNHGISGGNTSVHLYSKMTDFVLENL